MKVQAIIPAFNAEKTIDKCLSSIVNQTYDDWETIVVDDGSTDKTFSLCEKYAQFDSRIKVIHQKNSGAGIARNTGLKYINHNGYVVFVDADDYIEKDYFESLSYHSEDLVFIDVKRIDQNHSFVESIYKYRHLKKETLLQYQMTGRIPWGGVRKAVKANVILNNNILYSSHMVGEESIYSFMVLYFSSSVGFISHPLYNYIIHNDSLSHSQLDDPWGEVAINLRGKLLSLDLYDKFAKTLNAFLLVSMAASLFRMSLKYNGKVFKQKAIQRCKNANEEIDKKYNVDYKSIALKPKIVIFLAKMKMYGFIRLLSRLINK